MLRGMGLVLMLGASLCAAAGAESAAIESGGLRLAVSAAEDGTLSESFTVDGVPMPYAGGIGAVQLDGGAWQALAGAARIRETDGGIAVDGASDGVAWRVTYGVTAPGLITKAVTLEATADCVLTRMAPAAFGSEAELDIAATSLQDIAAFLRKGDRGLFVSLDFPYSRIVTEEAVTRVTYPPHDALAAGEAYACHTVTFGATRPTGEVRYGRDTGEVAAMETYVQGRFTPRFDRPMFVSACINNRYTQPQGGMVWYTYKDHPTLSFHKDLFKRELELMPEIGMEYYQVFPGIFDWVEGDPDPAVVHELVAYGNAQGVRLGDYSGCNSVFCGHYNEYGKTLDEFEWRMRDAADSAGGFCFGCPEFAQHYHDTVTTAAKEFGFEIHCLDFLGIAPCHADHGHPAGEDSLYHQVRGLIKVMEGLNAVDPDMMVWSNSGNWAEFLPKIVWTNQNVYLTDPYIATPWQGLNMTRLLDDARREQMVALHYQRFTPYRNYTNCQYFFSQNSIVPDIRNYQYGALATLAVTPNLCLAEVRPWMDRLPADKQDEVKAFYQRWTQLMIEHYDLWKRTHHFGDDPGPGAIEVYGHAAGDHGYVFVVNANYWDATAEVPLDARLGFDAEGLCEVRQLHPTEQWELTSAGPTPAYGTTLEVKAPAQQVVVLEVRPAEAAIDAPRVYGVPATLAQADDGWTLETAGPQGVTARFAVRAPEGEAALTAAEVRTDKPKQALRHYADTPLAGLGQDGACSLFEVTFRRTAAPIELRDWTVRAGSGADGEANGWMNGLGDAASAVRLPLFAGHASVQAPVTLAETRAAGMGPLANFCGGYVDNAFSEMQPTWIDLRAGEALPAAEIVAAAVATDGPESPEVAGDGARSWWLQTDFHLPFMYTIGAEPAFDEHTVLVLPMVDAARVTELKAWVNGAPLNVQRYAYPRNRGLSTWWATLVGTGAHGGDNRLVVHVEFAE